MSEEKIIIPENTLSAEQAEEVKAVINNVPMSEDEKLMKAISSGQVELDPVEDVTVSKEVTIDPSTGIINNVGADEKSEEEDAIDREMARLLDINVEDLYSLPKSQSEIPYDRELVKENILQLGFENEADIIILLDLIDEYRATAEDQREKLNWYPKLPNSIQDNINKQCASVGNNSPWAKKTFALELIKGLIMDAGIDRLTIDMQKSLQEAFDMGPLMEMLLDKQKTAFEVNIQDIIDKMKGNNEAEEKIKQLEGVRDAYIESYTLNGLYTAISNHKIKVKDFDVEKYARHCETFLFKYKKDTQFIISDISACVPILIRKLPEYTSEQLAKFIIAFIKYTQNMSAYDVVDHTFMSYFISNIRSLDLTSTDITKMEFSTILLSNIDKCVRAINKMEPRDYYNMIMADTIKENEEANRE